MSYESKNKSILLLLLHVLKFKLCLIDLSLIHSIKYSHNMGCNMYQTNGHLFIAWLGLGCVCSCLLKHEP